MNNFLQLSKSALANITKYETIYVVLGNESCDLDSAISALVYAYFLHTQKNPSDYKIPVIPILNIQQDEFPLRTETKYFLQQNNINIDNLIFRNNLNLSELASEGKLKLILVDHHVLPQQDKNLAGCVIEVIDHRPVDPNSNWEKIKVNINLVGSCCTLIANEIFNQTASVLTDLPSKLLHGTIILDTINFNNDANRFTKLDQDIISRLEQKFTLDCTREKLFNDLVSARSDVSSLTPFQILHRDMKIISAVPFPGVPMLVSEFLKLPSAEEAFKLFCQSNKCKVIVPMGLATKDCVVFREVGVFAMQECELQRGLLNRLKTAEDLQLREVETGVSGLVLFSQGNVKASRKHIVPILSNVISDFKDGNKL